MENTASGQYAQQSGYAQAAGIPGTNPSSSPYQNQPAPVFSADEKDQAEQYGQNASVAIPTQSEMGVPKWFYVVFAATLCGFFLVTALVVRSMIKSSENVVPEDRSESKRTQQLTPASQAEGREETSEGEVMPALRESDEIDDVMYDLQETDFSSLEKDISELENMASSQVSTVESE